LRTFWYVLYFFLGPPTKHSIVPATKNTTND
jgi:hypothetical protein